MAQAWIILYKLFASHVASETTIIPILNGSEQIYYEAIDIFARSLNNGEY